MKTATTNPSIDTVPPIEERRRLPKHSTLQVVHKSHLHNHHFGQHQNNLTEDPANWDHSWFAQYE
ncbi:MAG TPA: hypothetical protein VM871_08530 [Flavisolibacter sp.]|nr:hypothetical protein [Flavisolibacter sp.]